MRLILMSDTHEMHRDVEVPSGDLLLHAGDWTFFSRSLHAIGDFDTWLGEQNLRFGSVLSPGNHESYLEANQKIRSLIANGVLLLKQEFP